ncbi:hypothetical protein ACE1CB_03830 [Aerosakkonema sp. BLCC-F2]
MFFFQYLYAFTYFIVAIFDNTIPRNNISNCLFYQPIQTIVFILNLPAILFLYDSPSEKCLHILPLTVMAGYGTGN